MRLKLFVSLLLVALGLFAQQSGSLHGVVTDPSGAVVPNAVVILKGAATHRTKTDNSGAYSFTNVATGQYLVAVIAKGFAVTQKPNFAVAASTAFNVQLEIKTDAQVMNVEDEVHTVNTDPASNATALVLGEKELAALSDDPDELAQELQAMAGPGGGPNGGQIYVDGFTGGNMPPKSSIREVRVNSNPYSTEYDRPGFGRVEIFTKPGSDKFRGQAFFQFNDQYFNSRNPLLTTSTRAPYSNKVEGFNVTGPIKANKASFGFDFERRDITENAFVNATTLDSSFNPTLVNQAIVTPQTRTNFSPRLDYTINQKNTLVMRYQFTDLSYDKNGVGGFNLASQGYNTLQRENTVQATETAVLSPVMINETRFQFMRSTTGNTATGSAPTISVAGSFADGGVSIGNSGNITNHWEVSNGTTLTHKTHTFKWGGRLRQSFNTDTSLNGFNGSFIFLGGQGPELDANNQPIANTSIALTGLEVYQRTLLFQQQGLSMAQIRLLGGGATQYTVNAGTPVSTVNQFDVGLFLNDDWRVKPNLTLSYGLRYETQTNIGDYSDWAPRFGLAWGIGGKANQAAKTVLRAGAGIFYDRIADTVSLAADRYNGLTQESYFIQNPGFFSTIPSLASLTATSTSTQQLKPFYSGIEAPRTYQASIGLERQINKYVRISGQYVEARGVHLLNSRNVNTPVNGVYPFGDASLRILTESAGFSRTHQLFVSPNINYKKMFLFGFYAFSHGRDNNEGEPSNPYNMNAEWGPSTFADVRHRFVMGTMIPLPLKVNVSPFVMASSGAPYDITTGKDSNADGYATERPSLDSSLGQGSCLATNLVYEAGYGCFNLNPAPGAQVLRNSGRGPAQINLNFRVSRTWSFGQRGESGMRDNGGPPGGGGPPPGGGGPGGGGMRGGGGPGGGGPPGGMFGGGGASGKKYNLTLTVSVRNLINHANYAAPIGDLSSPYFGQSTSLAGFGPFGGSSTFNRKIDLQLRFQF